MFTKKACGPQNMSQSFVSLSVSYLYLCYNLFFKTFLLLSLWECKWVAPVIWYMMSHPCQMSCLLSFAWMAILGQCILENAVTDIQVCIETWCWVPYKIEIKAVWDSAVNLHENNPTKMEAFPSSSTAIRLFQAQGSILWYPCDISIGQC